MPDRLSELAVAIEAGADTQARSALADVPADLTDEALMVLARHAADGSTLAPELLVQTLDETGVVRASSTERCSRSPPSRTSARTS